MDMDPIFIGMVAMKQVPKYEVEHFITYMQTAGTRFVHFSQQNRAATKAFSERLGLETVKFSPLHNNIFTKIIRNSFLLFFHSF
jgi:hypothetical protein